MIIRSLERSTGRTEAIQKTNRSLDLTRYSEMEDQATDCARLGRCMSLEINTAKFCARLMSRNFNEDH